MTESRSYEMSLEEVNSLVVNLVNKYTTTTEFIREKAVTAGMRKLAIHPDWLTAAARVGLEKLIDLNTHKQNSTLRGVHEHWNDNEYVDEHVKSLPPATKEAILNTREGKVIVYPPTQCRSKTQDAYYKNLQAAGKLASFWITIDGVRKRMVDFKGFDLLQWGNRTLRSGETMVHTAKIAIALGKSVEAEQTPVESLSKAAFDKIIKSLL